MSVWQELSFQFEISLFDSLIHSSSSDSCPSSSDSCPSSLDSYYSSSDFSYYSSSDFSYYSGSDFDDANSSLSDSFNTNNFVETFTVSYKSENFILSDKIAHLGIAGSIITICSLLEQILLASSKESLYYFMDIFTQYGDCYPYWYQIEVYFTLRAFLISEKLEMGLLDAYFLDFNSIVCRMKEGLYILRKKYIEMQFQNILEYFENIPDIKIPPNFEI